MREVYEIVTTRKWKNEESRVNKIVFIGIHHSIQFISRLGYIVILYINLIFFLGRSLNEEVLVNTIVGCTM